MRPLAHHAGEQALAALLLGGSGLSLMVAIGRARLAATRSRLTRRPQRPEEEPRG